MRLYRSLYGHKDVPKIWHQFLVPEFAIYGLNELRAVPCIFKKKGLIVTCYVDDPWSLQRTSTRLKNFKRK